MKAISFTKYGSPDYLELKEIDKPTPKDDEVLIKIHATSINSWDFELLSGKPFANRAMHGLLKPQIKTLGGDIAGKVVEVGKDVKQFSPGDEVLGDLTGYGWGGFAEYVCANENALALKLASITFEEAAATPQSAALALQGIRDKGQVQAGQKVLINGAGGGVGTFALQIAKLYGAEVTGVDSTEKLAMMRSIGADYVIDYTKEDFAENGQHYDLILDNVATRSISTVKSSLSPVGNYIIIGGSSARIMQFMFLGPLFSKTGKKLGLLMYEANKDLDFIQKLIEEGKIKAVIDKSYSLSEVPDALQYVGDGYAKGKVVITI